MQFPAPREAFATAEMNCLKEKVSRLNVYSYRTSHPKTKQLVSERGLENIGLSFHSMKTALIFPYLAIKYFGSFLYILKLIFRHFGNETKQQFKTTLLVPRALQILDDIIKSNPDVIHLYWSHFPALLGLVLKKRYNKKVSMSLAAYDLTSYHWATKELMQCADGIITIAHRNLELIKKFDVPYKRLEVLRRGTDPSNFCHEYPAKKPFSLISAGALIPGKRMDECVKVYQKVKEKYPETTLRILGEGLEREKIEALIGDDPDVLLTGHCTHQQVFEHFRSAEVFVLMSDTEHIPNVAKEAIASRAYCISTDTTGTDELVKEAFGRIIPIGDIDRAVAEIELIFGKRETLPQITKDALHHLDQYFNFSKNLDFLMSMWETDKIK